jgi:hypothetical protein
MGEGIPADAHLLATGGMVWLRACVLVIHRQFSKAKEPHRAHQGANDARDAQPIKTLFSDSYNKRWDFFSNLAERGGFEPPIELLTL